MSTTPPRIEHTYSPDLKDGQQRGIQPLKGLPIPPPEPPEPPHRAPIPLPPPTNTTRASDHTNDPREGGPFQYPQQAQPDEDDQGLESFLDEYNWMALFKDEQLNDEMTLLNDEQPNDKRTPFNDEQRNDRMTLLNDEQLNDKMTFFNDEQLNGRMLE